MKEQFSFLSFQDQLEIKGLIIQPKQPIGILQIAHGMSEHKERYLPFMETMAQQGWICVIHDHRGHGESVKSKEDLGYFYDTSGSYIVEDVHQVTYLMKKRFLNLPYVLFGHSMGSLVVRAYTKKYDYELDALIVCGSPSKNPLVFAAVALTALIARFKGDHYRSALIQRLAFGSFAKRFAGTSENRWICSDADVVKQYDADPKCGFIFTANGFLSLWNLLKQVYDEDGWVYLKPQLPILFIAGEQDPCIINKDKFKKAYQFLQKVGYQTVSAKLYPDMRHELLNEVNQAQVIADIAAFLDEKLPNSEFFSLRQRKQ